MMRRFVLVRDRDVSGVSGAGAVVWGLQYPDGQVSYRWNTPTATTVSANTIEDVVEIHGHDGATRVVWLDTELGGETWRLAERDASAASRQPPGATITITGPELTALIAKIRNETDAGRWAT